MRLQAHLAVALFAFTMGTACEAVPGDSTEEEVAPESSAIDGTPDVLPAAVDYFTVTADPLVCTAPTCGGYEVRAANLHTLQCPDGTVQSSCHVAWIDLSALDLSPLEEAKLDYAIDAGRAVIRGKLIPSDPGPGFPGLAAKEGWVSGDAAPPSGVFFRLQDTGEVCVTAPCFHFTVNPLNLLGSRRASALDWQLPAPPSAKAVAQLHHDGILITGTVSYPPPLLLGGGVTVHVAHHYLRVDHQGGGITPVVTQ
jgi:hypothetical protein